MLNPNPEPPAEVRFALTDVGRGHFGVGAKRGGSGPEGGGTSKAGLHHILSFLPGEAALHGPLRFLPFSWWSSPIELAGMLFRVSKRTSSYPKAVSSASLTAPGHVGIGPPI